MRQIFITTCFLGALFLFSGTLSPVFGLLVGVGEGVSFGQVDFLYEGAEQLNSNTGIVFIDFQTLTGSTGQSSGFVNVYDAGGNWLVQNIPVQSGVTLPGLSTMFDLGFDNGTAVESLNLEVHYNPIPIAAAQPENQTNNYLLSSVNNNAQGVGEKRTIAPSGGPLSFYDVFDSTGKTEIKFYEGHGRSVEQDYDQCAPAAIANSLMYLHNTTPVEIKQPHVPGIGNEDGYEKGNSLVGDLDLAMSRQPGKPVTLDQMINGKLKFVGDNDLGGQIITKHRGFDDAWGGDGSYDFTVNGITSYGQGKTLISDWILDEMRKGEDVELVVRWDCGGGHAVNLIGGGTILGVPWVAFVHDAMQGIDGGTGFFDGGFGFSFLIEHEGKLNFQNYAWGGDIDYKAPGAAVFAMSQSYIPAPGAVLLATVGTGLVGWLRRRRVL